MPVRRNSGHFTRFFGIARNRKSAEPPAGYRWPELCYSLISVSDVKTTPREQKPCRYFKKPCRSGTGTGQSGAVKGLFGRYSWMRGAPDILTFSDVKYRCADVSPIPKTGLLFIETFRHHCPFPGISMTRKKRKICMEPEHKSEYHVRSHR